MTDARGDLLAKRTAAYNNGFRLCQCDGKIAKGLGWQRTDADPAMMATWHAPNTGALAARTPGADIDIMSPEAAEACEEVIRALFDDRGTILVRTGLAPKRLIPFRASAPFSKITILLKAPNAKEGDEPDKLEFLGEGQQYVIDGIHPDTGRPYAWHGDRSPLNTPREDLPEIDEKEARALWDYLADDVLCQRFGYERTTRSKKKTDAPVDVDKGFATMAPGSINDTAYKSNSAALLQRGEHPDDVVRRLVDEVMIKAPTEWTREKEEKRAYASVSSTLNWLLHECPGTPDTPPHWLHGEFHPDWLRIGAEGKTPNFGRNASGFFLRGNGKVVEFPTGASREDAPRQGESSDTPTVRFKLLNWGAMRPGPEPLYLVDEFIPVAGLVDVWGKAKCYKSFFMLTTALHVSMGWEFHDRAVRQCPVVYCAFEGAHGYKKRIEALRRHYNISHDTHVPLYIMPGQANLIADHRVLIHDIKAQLGAVVPGMVVLDTLNKSLVGSESKDVDMAAYVRAAEAIRDAFGCVVVIVHHCGYDDTHPRGHTSLPGAVDAQLHVSRTDNIVTVVVEFMRDGPEDTEVTCKSELVEVGHDQNGKLLTSLVLVPCENDPEGYQRKWSQGHKVFYHALKTALAENGATLQEKVGEAPIAVVKQKHVRALFYANITDPEEDPKKRGSRLRQAWGRALKDAAAERLIRTVEHGGVPYLTMLIREEEPQA